MVNSETMRYKQSPLAARTQSGQVQDGALHPALEISAGGQQSQAFCFTAILCTLRRQPGFSPKVELSWVSFFLYVGGSILAGYWLQFRVYDRCVGKHVLSRREHRCRGSSS